MNPRTTRLILLIAGLALLIWGAFVAIHTGDPPDSVSETRGQPPKTQEAHRKENDRSRETSAQPVGRAGLSDEEGLTDKDLTDAVDLFGGLITKNFEVNESESQLRLGEEKSDALRKLVTGIRVELQTIDQENLEILLQEAGTVVFKVKAFDAQGGALRLQFSSGLGAILGSQKMADMFLFANGTELKYGSGDFGAFARYYRLVSAAPEETDHRYSLETFVINPNSAFAIDDPKIFDTHRQAALLTRKMNFTDIPPRYQHLMVVQ